MEHTAVTEHTGGKDRIEETLNLVAQGIISIVFGFLPLFFVPWNYFSLDYAKELFVVLGVLLSLIFFSLSLLRSGKVRLSFPAALIALWAVAIVAIVSSVFSGDMSDSFVGNTIEVHTSLFIVLLAVVATVVSMLMQHKTSIMRLYVLLTVSASVLALFHVTRLFFGPDFLSLGRFVDVASSPIGGFNDLALFFGLSILLSLVALEQLPLTKWGKAVFSVGIALSLVMLSVINFFAVWIVLALVSLVVLMYGLTKDRFGSQSLSKEKKSPLSLQSVMMSTLVFIIALVFIVGGRGMSTFISEISDVSYIEVRPSFEATFDIARDVYAQQNAFLGIGPNKFIDAWRLYKDPSINQTIFWATDFTGGHGYISTLFVTTGVLGAITWLVFFGLFLYTGVRMLFKPVHADRFWYFIGTSSFISAVYLWGMSLLYVPGAAILLLASICTGISFAAYAALTSAHMRTFSVSTGRQAGFVLVGGVMLCIIASSTALYLVSKHAASVQAYGSAVSNIRAGSSLSEVEQGIVTAFDLFRNDAYARQLASYQLAKINTLLSVSSPTEQQQQQFQEAIGNGVNAARSAVDTDPTDPRNWAILGNLYSVLASANVEGAKQRALETFESAREYDPSNPTYDLFVAQLHSRTGDMESAREAVNRAIDQKPNYTDALFFLTQLEIATGNTQQALQTTRAMISLEPNNPARYYQLGVLQSALGNVAEAVVAFERSVSLDRNYANARYLLALAHAQTGNRDGALEQLRVVSELNPNNQLVTQLIGRLESGQSIDPLTDVASEQIEEQEPVEGEDGVVTAADDPDSSLLSPVNTPNDADDESQNESDSEDVQSNEESATVGEEAANDSLEE